MGRRRELAWRLGLMLLASVLTLSLAEGLYRHRASRRPVAEKDDGGWSERVRHMNRTIYRASADPELIYEPVPGAWVDMHYGGAGFNAASMRDDREHAAEPAGRRVALVGDSIAWGEELALEDSPARALEAALGEEVLAFGVTGYDTVQEARWVEVAVRPWRPTDVVLLLCLNDALIVSGPHGAWGSPAHAAEKEAQDAWLEAVAPVRAETLDRFLADGEAAAPLKLLGRARSIWTRRSFQRSDHYTDELLLSWADPARVVRVEEALGRMGALLAEDHVRAWLVISPVLKRWEDYPWAGIHARVRAAGESAGFTVIDPLESWRHAHDPADLRLDSLHYSPHGSRVLGQGMADAVR